MVGETDGEVIVRGDAEVRGLVHGHTDGGDHDAENHEDQLYREGRGHAEDLFDVLIKEGHDVADGHPVKEGAEADVFPSPEDLDDEKERVRHQVHGAEGDPEELRGPEVERRDGVIAQPGLLEEGDAEGNHDTAEEHTDDAACTDLGFLHSCCLHLKFIKN